MFFSKSAKLTATSGDIKLSYNDYKCNSSSSWGDISPHLMPWFVNRVPVKYLYNALLVDYSHTPLSFFTVKPLYKLAAVCLVNTLSGFVVYLPFMLDLY